MRILDIKDAFNRVKLGGFTYYRHSRVLKDNSGLTLFTLKHVDAVIFETLVTNSAKGVKSPNELLLSIGWPDRSVTSSSLTMKITALRKMLAVGGYDVVSVKNVGYYIPGLLPEQLEYDTECGLASGELMVDGEFKKEVNHRLISKINGFLIVKYAFVSFFIVMATMLIINWDV